MNQVELVILLAIPKEEEGTTHLTLLAELVTRLSDEEYKNNLLKAGTNKELFDLLDSPSFFIRRIAIQVHICYLL
ncbi:PTS sugar transporter subunit IIA [Bacillus sp. AFS088145]|uniref:PTS sugar transporter subunit IIA n=1 Tax=Bacillus sp. AFS088145 TaxID=2033514 RepID=UPI000BF37305|nr:PTS sugar transporter subunit IIA [Bacillus sp. AFS088145]PFH90618.1 hypothetical protein COI44_03785 [Bacillus sp. AFS088145]